MKKTSPLFASWRTSSSSKRPDDTASLISASVVPGRSPAKIGPSESAHHISVLGSPPVTLQVVSFGCTCTESLLFASITFISSGKSG